MSSNQETHSRKTEPRRTTRLSRNLEKNLFAYATAAASAGLFTAALPAVAEVIYTPSNIPMALPKVNQGPALTSLDLTNKGIPDFGFVMSSGKTYSYYGTTTRFKFLLKVVPAQTGNGAIQGTQVTTAAALSSGAIIGPKAKFGSGDLYMQLNAYSQGYRNSGSWETVEFAYVGLKFLFNGQVHYGWARVKFPYVGAIGYPSIYGYAYETVPNHPITAGQTSGPSQASTSAPATLGMLAAGTGGVKARRGADPSLPNPQ